MQYHRFLSSAFQNAVDEMVIPYNPASKAKAPRIDHTQIESFEVDVIANILDALDE